MKIIWTIIGVFVVLILGLIVVRLIRSDLNYQAQAEIEMQATRTEVYNQIAILEHWMQWSPFVAETAGDVVFDDDLQSPSLSWPDPRGGVAVFRLLAIDSTAGAVQHELQSPIFPPMQGIIQVTEIDEERSRVTWKVNGTLPNSIFYRLLSESYGESLGGQLNQSLHRLKQQLENRPEPNEE